MTDGSDGERRRDHSRRNILQTVAALGAVSGTGVAHGTATAREDSATRTGHPDSDADDREQTEVTELRDWHDLNAVRENPSGEYALVADLDETTAGYDEHVGNPDAGWTPIDVFEGVLDGNGHRIASLRIDRPDTDIIGLVGFNKGTVSQVNIVDCDVTGNGQVGSLVSTNQGTVSTSSTSGSVTGVSSVGGLVGTNFDGETLESSATCDVTSDTANAGGLVGVNIGGLVSESSADGSVVGGAAGGLVGVNNAWGEVVASSASGSVSGQDGAGGLVAFNNSTVSESSASGDVTGDSRVGGLVGNNSDNSTIVDSSASGSVTGNSSVGGLVGNNLGEVTNSHYNIDEVTINGGKLVTVGGLFDAQYQDWAEDGALALGDYDSLQVVDGRIEIDSRQGVRDALGFVHDPENDWRLVADIDLSNESPDLYLPYLAGNFDGNGFTITVDIDVPAAAVGCIGYKAGEGVRNLTVEGPVVGDRYVGGLVGAKEIIGGRLGEIRESSAVGDVTGGTAGGLVGRHVGDIAESAAEGDVTGDDEAGGLVGRHGGTITKSVAEGEVTSDDVAGGLVGVNYGEIASSSARGSVSGTSSAGGLVGKHRWKTVKNSFATGVVSEAAAAGGLVGTLGETELDPDDEAVLRDAYWDTQTTGRTDAVGVIEAGEGTAELRGEVAGLTTDEMQGNTAQDSMGVLDFETIWVVVTDSDEYPLLRWQAALPGGPPPLPGLQHPPQDPDEDGLYEDIDGDGAFTVFDVQAFFNRFQSDTVQENAEFFSFNDGGGEEITIFDVQGLFNRLQDWDKN